ncbi:hypothetical protein ALC57_06450 [Trachymyrmex cornetzi]|uniref:Uncharacterized protein n=1 Tax=Trachymyrmex cornetzi TaxID=471704 RepID=A0A151J8J7_9HYME|nr:hypothetical protein ALC57_06450 [Trachymyrmex cornetzi]
MMSLLFMKLDLTSLGYACILKWYYRFDYLAPMIRKCNVRYGMPILRSSGDLIWVNTFREYCGSRIKVQLLRIFQSSVTICRSDKIALFLVINLLNLECTAERAPHSAIFFLNKSRFLQRKFYLKSAYIGNNANRYFGGASRDKKRLAELTGAISFCATVKHRIFVKMQFEAKWLSSRRRKYKFLHKSSLKHMSHVARAVEIAKNQLSMLTSNQIQKMFTALLPTESKVPHYFASITGLALLLLSVSTESNIKCLMFVGRSIESRATPEIPGVRAPPFRFSKAYATRYSIIVFHRDLYPTVYASAYARTWASLRTITRYLNLHSNLRVTYQEQFITGNFFPVCCVEPHLVPRHSKES